jgi:hypothetical protein
MGRVVSTFRQTHSASLAFSAIGEMLAVGTISGEEQELLDLSHTKVSNDGAMMLQQALPNCTICHDTR